MNNHNHYYKDVRHLNEIDVYRILDLYGVTNPAIQHAVKKLLVGGSRGGGKDIKQDFKEAFDSIKRALDMLEEDMNTPCKVTADVRQYTLFQPSAEEVWAIERSIEERAYEFMDRGNECYPFSTDNFFEAVENGDMSATISALQFADYFTIGKELYQAVYKYYKDKATKIAETEAGY